MSDATLMSEGAPSPVNNTRITVTPHAGETTLHFLLIVLGIVFWVLLLVSIVGGFYALFFGLVFFFAHLTMIASIRGNSVKLSQQQMPKLYARVEHLSGRIGMKHMPDVYLLQSGGVLNAFATKFGTRNFIVLYSDIVRSCGSNTDALDFIIGHELGHLHRGHLRWRWLKMPALLIPFVGSAYSRACEYTCDSYGKFSCTDPKRSLDSFCLLACGATFAPSINKQAFVAQNADLNTVFMKLGTWLMSHPPLSKRVAAIAPGLQQGKPPSEFGSTLGAIIIAALLFILPVGGTAWLIMDMVHNARQTIEKLQKKPHAQSQVDDESEDADAPAEAITPIPFRKRN